jgi:hypothetical protein
MVLTEICQRLQARDTRHQQIEEHHLRPDGGQGAMACSTLAS